MCLCVCMCVCVCETKFVVVHVVSFCLFSILSANIRKNLLPIQISRSLIQFRIFFLCVEAGASLANVGAELIMS